MTIGATLAPEASVGASQAPEGPIVRHIGCPKCHGLPPQALYVPGQALTSLCGVAFRAIGTRSWNVPNTCKACMVLYRAGWCPKGDHVPWSA